MIMTKREARAISQMNLAFGPVKAMLKRAYDNGYVNHHVSKVNKSLSRGAVFNIMWTTYGWRADDDAVDKPSLIIGVRNALYEFGDFWDGVTPPMSKKAIPDHGVFHQEALDPYIVPTAFEGE